MDYIELTKLTKEEIINAIKKNEIHLFMLSKIWRDDKEVVLEAVKINGISLESASERLKNDKEIIVEAMLENARALKFVPENLQNDKNLLEILEKENTLWWNHEEKRWKKEKMNILINIKENLEEKEIMEKTINYNNITSKKVKF